MKESAGILLVAEDTGRALFLKRGAGGDHAGTWSLPGGHGEGDETPLQTALRETQEEIGDYPKGKPQLWTRRIHFAKPDDPVFIQALHVDGIPELPSSRVIDGGKKVDFTTFKQSVPTEFAPTISDEHVAAGWYDLTNPPQPLHPGCAVALRRFGMDELGVAREIAAGELTSPQTYANVTLFELRVTGTGAAVRSEKKDKKTGEVLIGEEHVWRPPEVYLTDKFLARCAGLPVIWKHPEKTMLNSKEFADRIIGTILFAFIRGDEVWCIAKVYEYAAIKAMTENQLSTSPGVSDVGNNVANLEDGSHVLVEEEPTLVDHLAVCLVGVWDKDGGPQGVASANVGETTMTDKADSTAGGEGAEERKDSATAQAEKPDPVLAKLDSAMGVLDSMAKRMDAMEADLAKDRSDKKAKKDAKQARKDRMDALKGRCDSGEASEAEREELKKLEGETMADKKKDKADAEEEGEESKEKKDAAAEAEKEKEKEVADKKDSAISSELEAVRRELADLRRSVDPVSREDADAMAAAQQRFDSVAVLFGEQAPRPLAGEVLASYRKRMLRDYQKHDAAWAKTNISTLDSATLDIAETQIIAAARKAGLNPTDLAAGQLRMIIETDPETGLKTRKFLGDADACWGRFKSNVRRLDGGIRGFNANVRGH